MSGITELQAGLTEIDIIGSSGGPFIPVADYATDPEAQAQTATQKVIQPSNLAAIGLLANFENVLVVDPGGKALGGYTEVNTAMDVATAGAVIWVFGNTTETAIINHKDDVTVFLTPRSSVDAAFGWNMNASAMCTILALESWLQIAGASPGILFSTATTFTWGANSSLDIKGVFLQGSGRSGRDITVPTGNSETLRAYGISVDGLINFVINGITSFFYCDLQNSTITFATTAILTMTGGIVDHIVWPADGGANLANITFRGVEHISAMDVSAGLTGNQNVIDCLLRNATAASLGILHPRNISNTNPISGRLVNDSLRYLATVTQAGVGNPVGTVLLGAADVWARTGVGVYTLTAAAGTPYTANKTTVFMQSAGGVAQVVRTNTSVLTITTIDPTTGLAADGLLTESAIEVSVWP